ncbi:MAG: glycosyltransferase family 39 protein [Bacteroidia bacterium]|nr:glycosyltransferase family 39 protein [Bacteroidia bacterium]
MEVLRRLWIEQPMRFFLWLAIVQVGVRWTFHLGIRPAISYAEDLDIALHLVKGEGFSIYDRGPTTAKGPIYPLFLSLFLMLGFSPADLWPVPLVQHFFLAWVPLFLFRLGKALGLGEAAKVAALLFAAHPSFLYYPTVLENTSLYIFLVLLWALAMVKLREQFSWGRVIGVGVGLGLTWIEKPVAFFPMMAAVFLLLPWRERGIVLAVAFLPVLFWAFRGYRTFGYFTWTKTYASQHGFALSWHPKLAVYPRYAVSEITAHQMDSLFVLPEQIGGPALASLGRKIAKEKGFWCLVERTLLHAAIFWWIPPRYWGDTSLKVWIGRRLPVIVINALFLLGLFWGWKYHRAFTLYVLLTSLFCTFFYALNHVLNARYRMDVEWLQLYVCAFAILWMRRVNPLSFVG